MSCVICLEEHDTQKVCIYCECKMHSRCLNNFIGHGQFDKCPCCRRELWLNNNEHIIPLQDPNPIIDIDYNSIIKNGIYAMCLVLSVYSIGASIAGSEACYYASILIPIFLTWLEMYLLPVFVYLNIRNGTPPVHGHLCLWILYPCTFYSINELFVYGLRTFIDYNSCKNMVLIRAITGVATSMVTFPCSISAPYGIHMRDYLRCC